MALLMGCAFIKCKRIFFACHSSFPKIRCTHSEMQITYWHFNGKKYSSWWFFIFETVWHHTQCYQKYFKTMGLFNWCQSKPNSFDVRLRTVGVVYHSSLSVYQMFIKMYCFITFVQLLFLLSARKRWDFTLTSKRNRVRTLALATGFSCSLWNALLEFYST